MKNLIGSLLLLVIASSTWSQCQPDERMVVVSLIPDNYPQETSWDLMTIAGDTLLSGGANTDSICVDSSLCLRFVINDSYGDGICCGYGMGQYDLIVDGDTVATGGDFGDQDVVEFNCGPGSSCSSPIAVGTGNYWAPTADTWYEFVPAITGMYNVSTCDSNTCDTKIWVYDYCTGLIWDNTNEATIYYDDNNGGCGALANLNAQLEAGLTYYIRIGQGAGSCPDSIHWSLSYNGPITGCMDNTACNYNPLAALPGQCYYYPDTNCPGGPDLLLVESALQGSLYMDQVSSAFCYINEHCLGGYGIRDVMRFDTHIKNIGDQDFYVGTPSANPGQFEWDDCHNHSHYEGYAEYRVYDMADNLLPVSYKNGFCVMDLECSGGGTAQYGCSNMGISHGCGDIYNAGLNCQWVDLTGFAPGDYRLVVTVNWDQDPDALGRTELTYDNNYGHVCFTLSYNAQNEPVVIMQPSCAPILDCDGNPYGNNMPDCEGNCNGTRVKGDVDLNLIHETADAQAYVSGILDATLTPSNCNDLNMDADLSVYDAALVNRCALTGNDCDFPTGIVNIFDTATFSILGVNTLLDYVDIGVLNPTGNLLGYQLQMSGINIDSVVSLANPTDYPCSVDHNTNTVIGISYIDSSYDRTNNTKPLVRLYYAGGIDTVCITQVMEAVNEDYEEMVTHKVNDCIVIQGAAGTEIFTIVDPKVYPNPGQGLYNVDLGVNLTFDVPFEVRNGLGQKVLQGEITSTKSILNMQGQSPGVYFLDLHVGQKVIRQKLVLY